MPEVYVAVTITIDQQQTVEAITKFIQAVVKSRMLYSDRVGGESMSVAHLTYDTTPIFPMTG